MKNKKIKLLIKVLIPFTIISICFGVEKLISVYAEKSFNKPIIVNDDDSSLKYDNDSLEVVSKESFGDVKGLTKNFGFINDNKVLLGIGMGREEFYEKYPDELDKGNKENDKLIEEEENEAYYGKVYEFNLADLSKKPLNIDTRDVYSDLLSGGNKLSYADNNKFYMYDLDSEQQTEYKDIGDGAEENKPSYEIGSEYMGNWSKDGKCLIYYEDGNINIYNALENTSKTFKVDNDNRRVNTLPSYYSDDGQEVYFIGAKYKKNMKSQGIFKLNCNNGEVEETLLLPPVDYTNYDYSKASEILHNDYSVLEGGKRIIFNGVIEGIDGTYIYDVENSKFYNVIPHSVKGEDGAYCSNIWVSPDKSKIVYLNLADEDGTKHWNLYAAKINGNSLTDRICLYKNINLCDENIAWSPDSKKILFFTGNDIVKNNIGFKDKNEINIITFK